MALRMPSRGRVELDLAAAHPVLDRHLAAAEAVDVSLVLDLLRERHAAGAHVEVLPDRSA